MITSAFLSLAYYIIKVLLSPLLFLPDVSLSTSFTSAITTASGYVSALNVFVPATTLITIISLVVLIEGYIFSAKIISWLLKKIPFIG